MEGQYRELIRQEIVDFIAVDVPPFTRGDVHLPAVAKKAVAVIGMRRTGKTTFRWQVLASKGARRRKSRGVALLRRRGRAAGQSDSRRSPAHRRRAGNAGGSFSINKFHGALHSQNIAVGKDTLHAYLAHLEDAFLVRTVSMGSESERKRMVNPRKVYPIDMGLIPIYDAAGRSNLGHALETAVLLELERRGAEISYVRTASGFEVDFSRDIPKVTASSFRSAPISTNRRLGSAKSAP